MSKESVELFKEIQWKFKSSMQHMLKKPNQVKLLEENPDMFLGVVYVFLMGWGDALLSNGMAEELRAFHAATKHTAEDGWLPDDGWKWWDENLCTTQEGDNDV